MALKWAHVHHIDFGTGFVFTYGPWGYTLEGYDPATFGQLVAVWSFFSAAFFAGVIVLCRSRAPAVVGLRDLDHRRLNSIGIRNVIQVQDIRMFALQLDIPARPFFRQGQMGIAMQAPASGGDGGSRAS